MPLIRRLSCWLYNLLTPVDRIDGDWCRTCGVPLHPDGRHDWNRKP